MTPHTDAKVRRIVSCSGRSWYTNATGASDYLFNPVFMTFFLMCVVLYATLIGTNAESTVPLQPRLVFWIGVVMTSLIWLFVSVSVSVIAYDRGLIKAIYMPLILLPLILMNVFTEQFVLNALNTKFVANHVTSIEYAVRNVVIIVTLEIMHARFVAPQHPTYVVPGQSPEHLTRPPQPDTISAQSATQAEGQPDARVAQTQALVANQADVAQIPATAPHLASAKTADTSEIVIARKTLRVSEIVWIKSEDHYLSIQLKDQNLMLRGKLVEVVRKLGDRFGVQINRSVWVAYDSIRTVDCQKTGNVEVHLEDDTIYSVSKARLLMFKQNFERFKAFAEQKGH